MQEPIKKIKQQLAQANLKTAFELFHQLAAQLQSKSLRKAVILLHSEYQRILRKTKLGTITHEQEQAFTNAVMLSFLDYLDIIEQQDLSEEMLVQKLLESMEEAEKMVQIHFGSGDNVAGDKIVNITAAPHKVPKRLTYIPPIDPNKVFGRTAAIEKLQQTILAHPKQLIAINGMGGIGKTTLLQTWYQQYQDDYLHKAWISIDTALNKAIISHTELLQNLDLRKAIAELPEKERLFTGFSLVINKLRELEGDNNLLLLDNAQEDITQAAIINRLADLLPNWTIVLASRIRFNKEKIHGLELELLEEKAAINLFQYHYPKAREGHIRELLAVISAHPLIITLAANVLHHSTDVDSVKELKTYLATRTIQEDLQNTLFEHAKSDEEVNLYTHLAHTFRLLPLTDYQRWLLIQFAVLPPQAIKDYHLQLLLQVPKTDRQTYNHSINYLYKTAWINGIPQDRLFFMHPTLQMIVELLTDYDLTHCTQLVDSLYRVYVRNDLDYFISSFKERHQQKLEDDYWLLMRYFSRLKQLDLVLEYAMERLPDIEEHENWYVLHRVMAQRYKEAAQFDLALEYYKKYIDAALGLGDDTIPFAVDGFEFIIGTLLDKSSKKSLEQAEGYLEDMSEYVKSKTDVKLNNLTIFKKLEGDYFKIIGEYIKAKDSYEDVLDIIQSQIPINEENLATAQSNLAGVYQTLGQYEKAVNLYETALKSDELNFGQFHPNVAIKQSNLALVYQDLGQYEKAVNLLEFALQSDTCNFGQFHPRVARCQSNLAMAYYSLGQYEKAINLFEIALKSDELNFGQFHPNVAIKQSNLALVYQDLGQYEKAVNLLEFALQSDTCNFGQFHPSVARCQSNLAATFAKIGHLEKAKPLWKSALIIYLKTFGKDHPDTKNVLNGIFYYFKNDLEDFFN